MYTLHIMCTQKVCLLSVQWIYRFKVGEVNVHFAHYVYPKSVPSFRDNGFVELKLREVNVRLKMYTLHIMCTPKVCLLSTTMDS
jgi:hypothetical protein